MAIGGCAGPERPAASPSRRVSVESEDPARPAGAASLAGPRVIVLGWDGADWSLLDRLTAAGKMPNLARLVREGRTARLKSFVPLLSPIIWTTLATGVDPEEHGVLDFQEIDRDIGAVAPISGASRRTPAIWNVASAAGHRVGVVGWWATHPAEEVDGFFVSDRAGAILFEGVREGIAFPTSLEAGVREVIDAEELLPDSDLASYIRMPTEELAAARRRGGGLENPSAAMAKILAATRTIQRIARDLYDRQRPELTAVYFEGTDAVGHVFASYVPPRLSCVSEEDFRRYSGAVEAYYVTMDLLLGQWMRRAEEDGATLLLCSDHGFKWEEDRSCTRSSQNFTTAAFWHRPNGVLAAWGARVEPSPTRDEASVFDLAPTIAALLGLPQDPKMRGEARTRFFRGVSPPPRRGLLASTEVRRVAAAAPSEAERSEYAEKLRALGYLSGSESRSVSELPAGQGPGRTEGAWNNLGLFQREEGRLADAERSFREALRVRPDFAAPMFNLAVLERNRGNWPAALALLDRALEAGHSDPDGTIVQWVLLAEQAGKPDVAAGLIARGLQRDPRSEKLAFEQARRRYAASDCGGALQSLAPFSEGGGRDTLNLLGVSELCLGRVAEARRYFERSLALDPAQPAIRDGLQEIERRSR